MKSIFAFLIFAATNALAADCPTSLGASELIFQRVSRAGVLTLGESRLDGQTIAKKFHGKAFSSQLEQFVDLFPIELSSLENPKHVSFLFSPRPVSFAPLLAGQERIHSVRVFRYRDDQKRDHLVIDQLRELNLAEILNETAAETLKEKFGTRRLSGIIIPPTLDRAPFHVNMFKRLDEVLRQLTPDELRAVNDVAPGVQKTFRKKITDGEITLSKGEVRAYEFDLIIMGTDAGPVLLSGMLTQGNWKLAP